MIKYSIFLIILCMFIPFSPVYSAEKTVGSSSSVWGENTSVLNSGFEGQKPVTDTSFNKTVKMLKERALTSKQRKIQNQVKPLSPSSDADHLRKFTEEQTYEDGTLASHTVMIPLKAYSSDGECVQPGYYKLSCRKLAKDEYVIDLSQGTTKVLSVAAKQTKQDLEQETLSFGNAEVIDPGRIRLIYGTIDLNLVGYLYVK